MIFDLLILLVLVFFFCDLFRKRMYSEDQNETSANHYRKKNYSDWQKKQLELTFYDKYEFARLSRDEQILSTYLYVNSKIEPVTFWGYFLWPLDERFRKEYMIRMILTGGLSIFILMLIQPLPWYIDLFFILQSYFFTDFVSYCTQRIRKVTRWDPEWTKHDALRTGSIMNGD